MNEYQEIIQQLTELKKRVNDIFEIIERMDVYKAATDPAYKRFCNDKGESNGRV